MIPNLDDKASASSIEWVVKIIDDYFLLVETLDMISHINLRAPGSIPVEGSSKKIIGGFPSIAIATDNFLLFPPESNPDYTFSNFIRSISYSFLRTSIYLIFYGIHLIAVYNSKCSRQVKFSSKASNYGQ